ncbi:MAG: hypothetical protein UY18_C0040G0006, partial [Microgenomates group bacterium GW2011_GWF2_47_9]
GWANGWILRPAQDKLVDEGEQEIMIFFWPQLLEYLGFAMLVSQIATHLDTFLRCYALDVLILTNGSNLSSRYKNRG